MFGAKIQFRGGGVCEGICESLTSIVLKPNPTQSSFVPEKTGTQFTDLGRKESSVNIGEKRITQIRFHSGRVSWKVALGTSHINCRNGRGNEK